MLDQAVVEIETYLVGTLQAKGARAATFCVHDGYNIVAQLLINCANIPWLRVLWIYITSQNQFIITPTKRDRNPKMISNKHPTLA